MRRSNLIWGLALIVVGILFLLNTLGILKVNVWGLIWPAILILIGVSVLWRALAGSRPADTQTISIPLEGATAAEVRLAYGAGTLTLGSANLPGEIVNGSFEGGLDYKAEHNGDTLKVKLQMPNEDWWAFPWLWSGFRGDWSINLNNQVPLKLEVEAGASQSQLDLSQLRVTDLKLNIGASSTEVTMPANAGLTQAKISAGAASVKIRIPNGVAARIQFQGGAASFEADSIRFPRQGQYRQSPDYESASNKIDLRIEAGAGSIDVV